MLNIKGKTESPSNDSFITEKMVLKSLTVSTSIYPYTSLYKNIDIY